MLNEAQCIIVCLVLFAYCICAESMVDNVYSVVYVW